MSAQPWPTETLSVCPVCGEAALRTVETVPDTYIPLLVLQQCAGCGVICLNPRLTAAAMAAVENASTVYSLGAEEVEQLVARELVRRAAYLGSFARAPQDTTRRRWLDIGCNRGLLLEAARRQGWQPVGVEIACEPAQYALDRFGLTVYPSLDEVPDEPPFGMITAWHVLEHTGDPVSFLRAAARKLAVGGALALQVPAYDFRAEFAARGQLSSLICSVHNFYFTLGSLREVLARTGLHILRIDADPQSLMLTAICSNRPAAVSWSERLRRLPRLLFRT